MSETEADAPLEKAQCTTTCRAEDDPPLAWKFSTVVDLSKLEALPPAAKNSEIQKAADTFASSGRNIFVHYVAPILDMRRKILLASGTTKKKHPKTAAQLYQTLDADQKFYWEQAAKELRLCMKKEILSPKACLVHGGRLSEREQYVRYAELAVATYLELLPRSNIHHDAIEQPSTKENGPPRVLTTLPDEPLHDELDTLDLCKDATLKVLEPEAANVDKTSKGLIDAENNELLDTLPDRFTYEQNTLYSHFARYDLNSVRNAEGKHQTAMLRQLADRFDKTGKVLFYYYVVPRICKQTHPPQLGETVNSMAAEVWRFLAGSEKDHWYEESAKLKRRLGDGDVAGVDTLQLDNLDPGVLKLHEMAESALRSHESRKT